MGFPLLSRVLSLHSSVVKKMYSPLDDDSPDEDYSDTYSLKNVYIPPLNSAPVLVTAPSVTGEHNSTQGDDAMLPSSSGDDKVMNGIVNGDNVFDVIGGVGYIREMASVIEVNTQSGEQVTDMKIGEDSAIGEPVGDLEEEVEPLPMSSAEISSEKIVSMNDANLLNGDGEKVSEIVGDGEDDFGETGIENKAVAYSNLFDTPDYLTPNPKIDPTESIDFTLCDVGMCPDTASNIYEGNSPLNLENNGVTATDLLTEDPTLVTEPEGSGERVISIVTGESYPVSFKAVIKTSWIGRPGLKIFSDDKMVAHVQDGMVTNLLQVKDGDASLTYDDGNKGQEGQSEFRKVPDDLMFKPDLEEVGVSTLQAKKSEGDKKLPVVRLGSDATPLELDLLSFESAPDLRSQSLDWPQLAPWLFGGVTLSK
jgi:hypothetical protein